MGNRERYENQRNYDRPDRDRRDEGMLERIKNDVKAWFEDDDDRSSGVAGSGRRNRNYGSHGYGDRSYGDSTYGSQDYGDRYAGTGSRNQDDEVFGGQYGRSRDRRPEVLSAEYWATPGPHAGIGPKGYKRSPDHLKERVCERLEGAGYIDASDIEVSVENEEVTLTGSVSDREQKRLAEDCAESVRGVSDVHNHLKIRRASDDFDSDKSGLRSDKSTGNPGKSSTKS